MRLIMIGYFYECDVVGILVGLYFYTSPKTQSDLRCVSALYWGAVPRRFVSSGSEVALQRALVCLEAEGGATTFFRAAQKERSPKSTFTDHYSPHPSGRVSYTIMGDFFSDLKSALGRRMLWEVVLGTRRNDLLGLAGQLAYFFLLFFFPFLIFLVSLTGLVIGNPEAGLKSLFEALSGLVP